MQFKNAIMMRLHHHCIITLWCRPAMPHVAQLKVLCSPI